MKVAIVYRPTWFCFFFGDFVPLQRFFPFALFCLCSKSNFTYWNQIKGIFKDCFLLLLFFHTFSLLAADGGNDFGWFELIQIYWHIFTVNVNVGVVVDVVTTTVRKSVLNSDTILSNTDIFRFGYFYFHFNVFFLLFWCGDGEECCRCSLKLLLKSNNYIVAAAVQFQR